MLADNEAEPDAEGDRLIDELTEGLKLGLTDADGLPTIETTQ